MTGADQTTNFRKLAAEIEQKFVRRHNEKPGRSRRVENRPSAAFVNLSMAILPLARELYEFRKMLEDKTQDYIFSTRSYSKMCDEEREELDDTVKIFLPQFGNFLNQLCVRIANADGLKNAVERNHLQRIQEGIQKFLKETTDFVTILRREHLKRVKDKNETLFDRVNSAEKDGHKFVYHLGLQEMALSEDLNISDRDDEIDKLEHQISEIQSLSSIFSEKIMDQERDIDVINDLALHTTENLIDGNEWIRKAITNSALRRVILLFCIIVLTFTLLFLDWYNP
ncbi:unnamed protein product [Caenorhabditis bovis]|uniref:t-SNARE coiled-coil homology domain-containing protein n=1 Tax=Caenorhabditis bovis TaxID=2654633 RepID=A0A8S1EMS8_9PELO|nr:unnamed protein product [Caenorhabditis bovis]